MNRLWLPCAVVVFANLYLLGGVWWNRSGEPEARVEVAAPQYRIERFGEENSAIAVHLLVVSTPERPPRRVRRPAKPGFAALAPRPDGFAVVGVSSDPHDLRARFPDRTKVVITRAIIDPHVNLAASQPVYAPLPYSRILNEPGSHNVTLCYGRSYEPWICGVTAPGANAAPPPPSAGPAHPPEPVPPASRNGTGSR